MSSRSASARVWLLLAAAAFALGAGGGFLLGYDAGRGPAPDAAGRLSGAGPPPARFVGGTVTGLAPGRITLDTDAGPVTVEIASQAPVEELLPVSPAEVAPGAAVNLGGTRSADGPALTGVVLLDTIAGAP